MAGDRCLHHRRCPSSVVVHWPVPLVGEDDKDLERDRPKMRVRTAGILEWSVIAKDCDGLTRVSFIERK